MCAYPPTDLHLRVYAYWNSRRDGRKMPARAELDPMALKPFLPHLILLDVLEGGYRYRLVGTQVAQDFGRDTTGTTVGSHISPPDYATAITGMFDFVRDFSQPVFTTGQYETPSGLSHAVSRLILPLGSESGVAMILISRAARSAGERGYDWLGKAQGTVSRAVGVGSAEELEAECRAWDGAGPPPPAVDVVVVGCQRKFA